MYSYDIEKPKLFTDQGQRMLIKIRDRIHKLLKESGAVRVQEALSSITGNSWTQLACIDRLVELEEITLIPQNEAMTQHYIIVAAR